jgi:hypothetical protein
MTWNEVMENVTLHIRCAHIAPGISYASHFHPGGWGVIPPQLGWNVWSCTWKESGAGLIPLTHTCRINLAYIHLVRVWKHRIIYRIARIPFIVLLSVKLCPSDDVVCIRDGSQLIGRQPREPLVHAVTAASICVSYKTETRWKSWSKKETARVQLLSVGNSNGNERDQSIELSTERPSNYRSAIKSQKVKKYILDPLTCE